MERSNLMQNTPSAKQDARAFERWFKRKAYMTTKEKQAQVAAQCRAVVHMAKVLAEVHEAKAQGFDGAERSDGIIDVVGQSTAYIMETIGNILNGIDAVDSDEDGWLDPIFAEAHRLWPQPAA